jgi:hypothetical protein
VWIRGQRQTRTGPGRNTSRVWRHGRRGPGSGHLDRMQGRCRESQSPAGRSGRAVSGLLMPGPRIRRDGVQVMTGAVPARRGSNPGRRGRRPHTRVQTCRSIELPRPSAPVRECMVRLLFELGCDQEQRGERDGSGSVWQSPSRSNRLPSAVRCAVRV